MVFLNVIISVLLSFSLALGLIVPNIEQETVNLKENDVQEENNIQLEILNTNNIEKSEPKIINSIETIEGFKTYGNINLQANDVITLKDTLSSYKNKISVIYYSLDDSKAISYNTNETFFSACTIKAGYCYYVAKKIDEGIISENDKIIYTQKHYHEGSGTIKKTSYGTEYSVEELIEKALSISDNVAYEMLIQTYGKEEYNSYVLKLGCDSLTLNNYSIWGQKVNAYDYCKLWTEIYNYFSTKTKGSEILKNACTNSKFNYNTKWMENIAYSHKSGDNPKNPTAYNDCSIIWTEKPYILITLTDSVGNQYDSNMINEISKLIYSIHNN